ncbi:MAG: prolyl oligopeptidase family serine peptidase [Candidatus Curtissbacteria bacterium]|nr:prolyl oligopeptidase family serine peptidase [Candidatus Curtissbacteria bacterium]
MKKYLIPIFLLFIFVILAIFSKKTPPAANSGQTPASKTTVSNPLAIDYMRSQTYPGSNITIEQSLPDGVNYKQYIVSYKSQDLKIYALLTVPMGDKPKDGWPVIIFNHGYIPPEQYVTTERYIAYVETFATSGYIVFKSDYRGNDKSEGEPEGAYYSPAYTVDILNAVSSIKKFADANPNKIGMWGHSLGGNITLRNIEVSTDIKAAVIWAGVTGSYNDLMNNWQRRVPFQPSPRQLALRNANRANLTQKYGTPKDNPVFWSAIDPFHNLKYISAPIQLHHGEADEEVPLSFSQRLETALKSAGKTVELYTYPGAGHNISGSSFETAIQRSLDFFAKYLK